MCNQILIGRDAMCDEIICQIDYCGRTVALQVIEIAISGIDR
jgi:hypothetical protein